ncbi:VRR-NUC domain-containing protein [Paenirhodobacter populi]|uniref:VRR-NUC domain-containing protein n=1 Tax=Paenirhodobacter populi TaxID=2306993 RepID=UPI001F4FC181|nr:VRR-NUC domain-containing protein [Sinirhodobacter populi]
MDREGPVQRQILSHLRQRFPLAVVHHSANEIPLKGRDVARAIAKAKFNGMVPGFPDLACHLPGGVSVFFEVKAGKNGTSPAQDDVLARLQTLGHRAAVVRSVADVDEALTQWGIA